VESLEPEVLNYVSLADAEFRIELVAKIFTAVQRFAPSVAWNFDTVHRIIIENGNSVGSDLITTFCALIAHNPELQAHAVVELSNSVAGFSDNQTLVQVSAWVVGEFLRERELIGIYETLKRILMLPQTTAHTKGYILTAIAKIAVRFGSTNDAVELFKMMKKSNALDVQQRAGEFISLFEKTELCIAALAPLEIAEDVQRPQKATLVQAGGPLLAEDNLISLGVAEESPPMEKNSVVSDRIKPFPGAIEALRKSDYVMYFEIKKNPQNSKQIAVRVSVFNLGTIPFTNFNMRFGVPFGWRLQAQGPSSAVLEPIGGKPILQQIMLLGESDVKLRMKTQISYQYGTQPIVENGEIDPIFD
jgi:hypothetical protein